MPKIAHTLLRIVASTQIGKHKWAASHSSGLFNGGVRLSILRLGLVARYAALPDSSNLAMQLAPLHNSAERVLRSPRRVVTFSMAPTSSWLKTAS